MTTQNLLFFDKKGNQYNFQWNGSYWEGAVLFPIVSEKLFEVENIFIIEKFLDLSSDIKYGYPHGELTSPGSPVWRTRWESDYDETTDVSSTIYTYELGVDDVLDAPVLVKANSIEFYPELVPGDTISSPGGIVITSDITSSSMQINIALNSDSEGIYDRTLIFEDYTDSNNPVTILRVSFHGEVEGEDSRLAVMLGNFGRVFNESDAFIVREGDIKEPLPDYEIINKKRKELLLEGESIFPYLGSYKSLFNAIKFFGYYDLMVKEYWLNIKTDTADTLTPLQQNNKILNQLAKPNKQGESSLELISSLLKDENQGKFKQVEVYGKRKDGTFGLKKQFEEIFPSKSYKKTSLFGLFYDINRVIEGQDEDQYGYPIVEDSFAFSPEEVLIKLFGLKERLKRDYLPLNARIIDITGEGVYFNIYKTRGWTDVLDISEIKTGIEVDFSVFPNEGYIEDLRVFYTKPNQEGLLYPAINGTELGISYYGNTIDPYSSFQEYPLSSISLLESAVNNFYQDIKNGNIPKFLGDGDYDLPGYKLFSDGSDYVFPAGCPVIIKNDTFNLSWEEVSGSWISLDPTVTTTPLQVADYNSTVISNPGGLLQTVNSVTSLILDTTLPNGININIGSGNDWFDTTSPETLFVRIESQDSPGNLYLGYVSDGDYNTITGNLFVQIVYTRGSGTYSNWNVTPTNLGFSTYTFEYYQNYIQPGGFYSWDRLPYLDFYEIEWTISKEDSRPYYFQTRGKLPELETIVHFLPYDGDYNIKCRVWDTLNSISLGIKRSVIKVNKRQIELNTLTRFRESETYDWNNAPLKWESYPSQWIFPVENTNKILNISDFIQNYPEYSNNFNEGQTCEVLTKLPEVKATTFFDVSIIAIEIINIVSIYNGFGYDLAVVTTSTSHGYTTGDTVWIYDSLGASYGQFPIIVTGVNTYQIPQIITTAITGGYSYGEGSIQVIADSTVIADCIFQGDLNSTCSLIYFTINSSLANPKYKIINLIDSIVPGFKTFTIQAPNDTGNTWNGKLLTLQTTGSIIATPNSTLFTGGLNQREEFLNYDFNTLPNSIMKYWGTKRLAWDTFEDFEFQKAYAHTWDMYDYHNDWLGGFDLYSLQYGDKVRITKDSNGIVFGETDSPPNNYLDLSEAKNQLNDSIDDNIKRFDYTVRGFSELPNNFYPNSNPISPDLSTNPGPQNIRSTFYKIPEYSPVVFLPTGIAWDGDGDIWVTGEDVVKFDGANYETYNSSNSVLPGVGLVTNCIKIDRDDVKWIGVENTLNPLVKIDDKNPNNSIAYSISDFIDNGGNPISPLIPSSVRVIEINPQTGDIFAAFVCNTSPSYDGLLFYDSRAKSWYLYTILNSNLPSDDIRDLRLEYYGINKWYLWIATDNGLSRFNGVDFKNYDITNSGIPGNSIYSIEIDSLNHKWIGTADGLVYWDNIRWAVWNNSTNPEILSGVFGNIVETGNSNIWFTIDPSASPGDTELYFFDGYFFTRVLYRNDETTLINPCNVFRGKTLLSAPWKTIKNGETTYPKNLLLVTDLGEIGKIDYVIPHIHATSKLPGTQGWDFVYHDSSIPLPSVKFIHDEGIEYSQLGFNFIIEQFGNNVTLNSDYTRPVMPNVDRYSWYKPIWQRYNINKLKDQFPSLNLNDVFLYAPLRDIIEGKATKESYWRNSQIERIAQKKSRNLFENFEWLITLGNSQDDQGIKVTVDVEGDIIAIGDFQGTIFMGEVNNIGTQNVYLTSTESGVYIAKYNKDGVLQWARSISTTSPQGPIYARSVITDSNCNVYVVSDNNLSGFIEIDKYNSSGLLLNTLNIPISPDQFLGDIKVDKYENVYICGGFQGTLNLGIYSLTSLQNVGFIAKLDSTLNFVWAKQLNSTTYSRSYELGILKEEYIYVTGLFQNDIDLSPISLTGVGNPDMFVGKFYTGDGSCIWAESFAYDSSSSFVSPSICLDPKGHVLITGSFQGTISIQNSKITSFPGYDDIFVIKILSTGKLIWLKMCGGESGDTSHDIESDSEENVYITGSYTSRAYFSPEEIDSRGGTDIYLTKFNKDGTLVDIVTAGGINNDSGADLVLDSDENIYITGYFEGEAEFSPYVVTSPHGGKDAFLGKIPKQIFNPGYKIGAIQSWLGSHSWSWKEEKFFQEEFEIPLATTIFINPIDSLVPGKKDHIWTLTDTENGEVIAKIRKTPYFIWTFVNPGFYTISCELQDANGNLYQTEHEGKIRVIDHKNPTAGDLIPEIVNSEDYLLRSIYYDRNELGFPPLSKFDLGNTP
jgi:hypothetical protein